MCLPRVACADIIETAVGSLPDRFSLNAGVYNFGLLGVLCGALWWSPSAEGQGLQNGWRAPP